MPKSFALTLPFLTMLLYLFSPSEMPKATLSDMQHQRVMPLSQEQSSLEVNQFHLLFMGNSHSASHDLPQLVASMLRAGIAGAEVETHLASGYHYLDERLQHQPSTSLLNDGTWTHVILQAQKYSTTGRRSYPTDSAEEWIRRVNDKNARAIMFPEWPREGNKEEGPRIHQLHQRIAQAEPACVAPIGLAWEQALEQNPKLKLYTSDGNHASLDGAFLTALVLYGTISKQDPAELPHLRTVQLNRKTQTALRQAASATLRLHPACAEE